MRSSAGIRARLSCRTLCRRPFTADSPSWAVCPRAGAGVLSPGSAAGQLGVVGSLSFLLMPTLSRSPSMQASAGGNMPL